MRTPHLVLLSIFALSPLRAELKVAGIFGDNMVLQAEAPLPVWGTASPGQVVTVRFGGSEASATATPEGQWRVTLPPKAATTTGAEFDVSGEKKVTFKDVVVGEVWLCSGQSNMEYNLGRAHNADEALPKANDPAMRFFQVQKGMSLSPSREIEGRWIKCMPHTALGFSAVAYFFGRDVRAALGRPVGLIGSYLGGTPAQAWTSVEGLAREPSLSNYLDEFQRNKFQHEAKGKDFPSIRKAYDEEMARWNKDIKPAHQEELKKWADAARAAQASGQPVPVKPAPSSPMPKVPMPPDGGGGGPGNLFNVMISPLAPYAIRGVIWYQGEANGGKPAEYAKLFPALIRDWRAHWQQGDFPFLFVQLARFQANASSGSTAQHWAYLREAQAGTLALPQTGMAVAYDIGDPTDIHPKDKLDVGKRLAAIALQSVYGRELVARGPVYRAMSKEGNSIEVTFDHIGCGLTIGSAPWVPPGVASLPRDKLLGFFLSDVQGNWYPADAKLEANHVILSNPELSDPVAVRYAWANCPDANLYNKDGFPAEPFRTDNIPYSPRPGKQ